MNDTASAEATADASRHRTSRTGTHDGLVLLGEHHLPSSARADVVLVHGFGEHLGRYGELVAELVAAGYACHLFDLRGHGDSGGRRGHVERFGDYRSDLVAFVEGAVRPLASAGRPLVLLGHSLGGLIVLDTLLARPGLAVMQVLSSPFLGTAFELPPLARSLVGLARRLIPRVPLLRGPDPAGLSRDPAVVAAYRADPRIVRRLTPAWAMETLAAQKRVLAGSVNLTLPSLMLLGGADPIADAGRSRTLFEGLGSPDKLLRIYDGMLHEVFHEIGRERVVADLLAWLDARRGTAAAGEPDGAGSG